MKKDIILFTGQSGIKIEECLKKLKNNNSKIEILKFEEEMIERYKKIYPKSAKSSNREIIIGILSLSPFLMKKLWDETFDNVLKRMRSNSKKIYFLSLHASFFHQKKTEFISPINLMKLKKLKNRVKMVIVFVDDCFDIYRPLLDKEEMFYNDVMSEKVSAEEALLRSIWNLFTILSWREVEIAFSRKIHEVLDVPLFIVPVKHPVFMIKRLIFTPLEKLKIFYLSHPITSIRKEIHSREPDFPHRLKQFAEELLNENKNLILFIPDTIDELRIKKTEIGEKKKKEVYIPELLDGWALPFGEENWLFCPPPKNVKGINPLNPKNFNQQKIKKVVSSVIEILVNKINKQITSRDLTLVEQSKNGIIVYQPYWNGKISQGCLKEVNYNNELYQKENNKERKTIVIETKENLGKYLIEQLFENLKTRALKKNIAKKNEDNLDNLKERWKRDPTMYNQLVEGEIEIQNIRHQIEKELGLDSNYDWEESFLDASSSYSSLKSGALLEKQEILEEGWKKIEKELRESDFIKKKCISEEDYLIIPSDEEFLKKSLEFINKIFKRIKKHKKGGKK